MTEDKALVRQRLRYAEVKNFLETRKDDMAALAGRLIDPQRLLQLMLQACARPPEGDKAGLLDCSNRSLLASLMFCAQVQLEPVGAWGVWVLPYRNKKTGTVDAQPQIDYRGMMTLIRRAFPAVRFTAHCYYSEEIKAGRFRVRYADDESCEHDPILDSKQRGAMAGAYAIAHFPDGSKQRAILTRADVDHYRAKSRASGFGPWVTDYDAMARKTALRRLCDMIPTDQALRAALELDDRADRGEDVSIDEVTGEVLDADVQTSTPAVETRTAEVPERTAAPIEQASTPEHQREPAQRSTANEALKERLRSQLTAKEEQAPDAEAMPLFAKDPPIPPASRKVLDEAAEDAITSETVVTGRSETVVTGREDAGEFFSLDAVRDRLADLKLDLAELIGPKLADQRWASRVQSLRGVRTAAHAQSRIDAAEQLVRDAKEGM